MSHNNKYTELFDYLGAENLPRNPEASVVFGRKDLLVAHRLGDLIVANLVETAVISGGLGKDSGDIVDLGFNSEASWLRSQLEEDSLKRGYVMPQILLDEAATNGGENSRNSINILLGSNNTISPITAVAHATSARRLAETLKFEAGKITGAEPVVHVASSKYQFDAQNPSDRAEAEAELLRLVTWPEKGFLGPQTDIPDNLVDFVTDLNKKNPAN